MSSTCGNLIFAYDNDKLTFMAPDISIFALLFNRKVGWIEEPKSEVEIMLKDEPPPILIAPNV